MRKYALLVLSALLLTTCTDKSSDPSKLEASGTIRQIKGCVSNLVLAKSALADSSFNYRFGDTLTVDFSLTGNCCPDSDRFALEYVLRNDSILVAATDTAEHLCHCICDYIVHAEFVNLPLNRYVFVCARTDDSGKVYYAQTVSRGLSVH